MRPGDSEPGRPSQLVTMQPYSLPRRDRTVTVTVTMALTVSSGGLRLAVILYYSTLSVTVTVTVRSTEVAMRLGGGPGHRDGHDG